MVFHIYRVPQEIQVFNHNTNHWIYLQKQRKHKLTPKIYKIVLNLLKFTEFHNTYKSYKILIYIYI